MITRIRTILSTEELEEVQTCLRKAPYSDWVDGALTAGPRAQAVKHNLHLNNSSLRVSALRIIQDAIKRSKTFQFSALPLKYSIPMINRYRAGMSYGLHTDDAIMGGGLRSDLAATLFLSSPTDYIGGELNIPSGFDVHSVKGEAGELVLYPANSIHEVTPIQEGTRDVAVFWVQSMIRDEVQREILWTQHESIRSLTDDGKASESDLLALSQNYQNLLRIWAQP